MTDGFSVVDPEAVPTEPFQTCDTDYCNCLPVVRRDSSANYRY